MLWHVVIGMLATVIPSLASLIDFSFKSAPLGLCVCIYNFPRFGHPRAKCEVLDRVKGLIFLCFMIAWVVNGGGQKSEKVFSYKGFENVPAYE